jgi:hypothetical protein
MVEPPMPPGPVDDEEDVGTNTDDDVDRREEAGVMPGDPIPDEEDPETA